MFANPAAPSKAWREELHPRDHGKFTDKSATRVQPEMGTTPKLQAKAHDVSEEARGVIRPTTYPRRPGG